MYPRLFELGPLTIYTYGVLLAAAYLLGLQLARVRAEVGADPLSEASFDASSETRATRSAADGFSLASAFSRKNIRMLRSPLSLESRS